MIIVEKKKRLKWQYIVIGILIILLVFIIYAYGKKMNGENIFKNNSSATKTDTTSTTTNSTTTTSDVEATVQTLTNTLSSSGEVSSGLTEKLELHATYYFEEVYYDVGDYVEEGTNILKYSNGTYLTAPYNLVIESLSLPSSGEECTSKNYINVESIDTLSLSASVDEDNLSSVSIGQEAKITISALDNKEYTGYVTKISETGNYSSNGSTFDVTIIFVNDGDVKIGMSASCQIILEEAENVVTVPIEAIETSGDTKYVVVVKDDGTTENVTVTTGISNDAYTEIKSGLDGTETVQITETTSNNSKGMMGGSGSGMQSMEGDQNFGNGGGMPSGSSGGTPPGGSSK